MNVILKLALKYLESHPQIIEQLIEELVTAIINEVKAHNQTQAAALAPKV
jgi:hypothetical protein